METPGLILDVRDWNALSADILLTVTAFCGDVASTLATLRSTCKAWFAFLSPQIQELEPLEIVTRTHHFASVKRISMTNYRCKYDHNVVCIIPMNLPKAELSFGNWRTVTTIDLSCQHLSDNVFITMSKQMRQLRSLLLKHCCMPKAELVEGLGFYSQLSDLQMGALTFHEGSFKSEETQTVMRVLTTLPLTNLDISSLPGLPAGVKVLGNAGALAQMKHLKSLNVLQNSMRHEDWCHLSSLSQLTALTISWHMSDESLHLSDRSWSNLLQLTNLVALHVELLSPFQYEQLSLAPLTKLTSLQLTGCSNVALAVSILNLTNLSTLDLSSSSHYVTSPHLAVQLCRGLPKLTSFKFNHANYSKARLAPSIQLPGDLLVQGLSTTCSQLQCLELDEVPLHGSGLAAPAGFPCLPHCTQLVLMGAQLSRSKYRDLCQLSKLQSLVLTHMTPDNFAATTRVDCLLDVSKLTDLTRLCFVRFSSHTSEQQAMQIAMSAMEEPVAVAVPGTAAVAAHHLPAGQVLGVYHGVAEPAEGLPALVLPPQQQQQQAPPLLEQQQQNPQAFLQQLLPPHPQPGQVQQVMQAIQQAMMLIQQNAGGNPNQPPPNQAAFMQQVLEQMLPGIQGVQPALQPPQLQQGLQVPPPQQHLQARRGAHDVLEPHMHFLRGLPQLQLLRIECMSSAGLCFSHLQRLTALKVLDLQGRFKLTAEGVACLSRLKLPTVESFRLMTCTWTTPASLAPPDQQAAAGTSGSSSSGSGRSFHPATTSALPGAKAVNSNNLLEAVTAAMPNLRHLELSRCPHLDGLHLDWLRYKLVYLRYLVLHGQQLKEELCMKLLSAHANMRCFSSVRVPVAADGGNQADQQHSFALVRFGGRMVLVDRKTHIRTARCC